MKISIIAAVGTHNELGKDNELIWNLPSDMLHFRETTRGHVVIMGRKTFESIGKPLPGRQNIIITRDTTYRTEGADIAHSLTEALEKVDKENYPEEVFIIGGAQIYTEALALADMLYITHIDKEFPQADTFFPTFDAEIFIETSREHHDQDERHAYPYDFVQYKKRA